MRVSKSNVFFQFEVGKFRAMWCRDSFGWSWKPYFALDMYGAPCFLFIWGKLWLDAPRPGTLQHPSDYWQHIWRKGCVRCGWKGDLPSEVVEAMPQDTGLCPDCYNCDMVLR